MRKAVHFCVPLLVASWMPHDLGGPAARARHAMASETGRLWLFGGGGSVGRFNDLWMFNLDLQLWFELGDAETRPPGLEDHIAVWDPGGGLWVHGGYDGNDFSEDLWKFTAGSWTRQEAAVRPGRRAGHVAVWDEQSSALWIHGGYDGVNLHQDTWRFDSEGGWSRVTSVSAEPAARAKHVGIWDASQGAFWIHGGYNGSFCNDLWKLHVGISLWHQVRSPGAPTGRAYHAAAWDAVKKQIWIHGGVGETLVAQGDLWRFDTASHTWSLMTTASPGGPVARYNHVAAWDASSMTLWIHGGQPVQPPGSGGFWLRDLWQYEGASSTSRSFTDTSTRSSTSTVTTSTRGATTTMTATITMTATATSTTTATTILVAVASEGFNPVSLTILLVASFVGMSLMAVVVCRGPLQKRCRKSKTVIMPMKQSNGQLLIDFLPSLPLPVPTTPATMDFGDVPALYGDGEWVLHIDGSDIEPPEVESVPDAERLSGQARNVEELLFGDQPSVLHEDVVSVPRQTSAPQSSEGGVGPQVPKDSQEVGNLPRPSQLPSPAGQATCLSLDQARHPLEEPPCGEKLARCAVQQCVVPSLDLPGLNLPGPLTMSELEPIIWPPTVCPQLTRPPLALPPLTLDPASSALPARRPSWPLATQSAEILLEPAMNPDPPPKPKVKRSWKRPRSTTLGGPAWTAQARTSPPLALKKSPGPAHYDPQHPNIHGRIPGYGHPGHPNVSLEKRVG